MAAPADAPAPAPGDLTTPSVAEQRATLAADFGITDPPDVPVLRLVTPEQRGALVETCLAERGYRLTEGFYEVPTAETDAFDLANYVCMASYPVDPSYVGSPRRGGPDHRLGPVDELPTGAHRFHPPAGFELVRTTSRWVARVIAT